MLFLHVYFDHKKQNNIRLSKRISVQVDNWVKIEIYSSCWEFARPHVFRLWLAAISVLAKSSSCKMQSQKKNLKLLGNVQVFITRFLKSYCFFSHSLSVSLVFNHFTLAAATLYETCNILIAKKKTINLLFFSIQTLWVSAKLTK